MPREDPAAAVVRAGCSWGVTGRDPATRPSDLTTAQWDRVLELADRHRVAPLVDAFVRSGPGGDPPARVLEELRGAHRSVARHNLALAEALADVVRLLDDQAITALAYKGPVTAVRLYGGLDRRQFLDLDIVVPPDAFDRAREAVESAGFEPKKRLYGLHEVVLASSAGAIVDLHAAVTPRYFPGTIPFDALWANRDRVDIGGATVQTLGLEDLLVVLAVHGTKHRWHRLAWVVDVGMAIATGDLDWARVEAVAREARARRMVALAASVADDHLGVPRPWQARGLGPAGPVDGLSRAAGESHIDDRDPSFARRFRYHARAMESRGDRLRYAWRLATQPTQAEFDLVRLPGRMQPLYTVVRPVRLLADAVTSPFRR